ncbi:hypothetical protein ARTSIC4J27_616 [Pseudarthrobacter siccitolerans]|uniref:Uncharacterized protein n=1 Tax=Pseudarthrobacter siccitolerans TaxID=861266 RepID=A0A024GYI0_9MICC|nr:hypothetical protein [Pseudarthrobacter siccitolerans]CCQ44687.1 hypothetical protein ARTSIC4J27_616 [Pseudarthrobacter siccitolerans]
MIARFLAWAKAYFEERALAQAPAPERYELRLDRFDLTTVWLLDHKKARKYPFRGLKEAETALGMVRRGAPPFLLHQPFTRDDYRKAR